MIDVDDTERRADIAERLSKRIGKPKEEIAGTLQQITALLAQKSKISDSEMRTVIDALDDMLNESWTSKQKIYLWKQTSLSRFSVEK